MNQTTQTTFVQHDPKIVNGSQGAFTIHKFKDAAGTWFQTTKPEIANAAYALLNQPVSVSWKPEQRGEYTNNVIVSVQPAGAAAVVGAPSGATAPTMGVTASTAATHAPTTQQSDDVGPRIARSVGHTNGLSALELALKAAELGITEITNPDQWRLFSHWIANEANALAGGIGSYIFKGSQPSQAAASADSSGVVGGTGAATAPAVAAPTTPVAPPAQQTETDDDIPF